MTNCYAKVYEIKKWKITNMEILTFNNIMHYK